jgi:hypothetical protein
MVPEKSPLVIQGHHGLGDNLHQRAIIRELLKTREVWLETSWAALYHDMIQDGLHLIRRPVRLRTQNKNAIRESALFNRKPIPPRAPRIRLHYNGAANEFGTPKTILHAMMRSAGAGLRYEDMNYSLPIPDEWFAGLGAFPLPTDERPVCVYRPLTIRPEWQGNERRNAQELQYAQLFSAIRAGFFVVSVADLEIRQEWITGPMLAKPDLTLHRGELNFEQLAALFSYADLVYTSSGFASILAQAVDTPVISVIGGYERAHWHATKPDIYCGIEPINPCACSRGNCIRHCTKKLDVDAAVRTVTEFLTRRKLPVVGGNLSDLYTEPPSLPAAGLRA